MIEIQYNFPVYEKKVDGTLGECRPDHINMISRTSVTYAQSYIKKASVCSLDDAITEELMKDKARISLIKKIINEINRREVMKKNGFKVTAIFKD